MLFSDIDFPFRPFRVLPLRYGTCMRILEAYTNPMGIRRSGIAFVWLPRRPVRSSDYLSMIPIWSYRCMHIDHLEWSQWFSKIIENKSYWTCQTHIGMCINELIIWIKSWSLEHLYFSRHNTDSGVDSQIKQLCYITGHDLPKSYRNSIDPCTYIYFSNLTFKWHKRQNITLVQLRALS